MNVYREWKLPLFFSQDLPFIKELERRLEDCKSPFTREDPLHFCATSLIINREHTETVMIYHKIFDSWSLPGGHADGEEDLLEVGKKEALEETGLHVEPVFERALAWDIIPVLAHEKNGRPVAAHEHLVGTYLYYGDEEETLVKNTEETKGVRWIPLDRWESFITEDHMIPYYKKHFRRMFSLLNSQDE